MPEPLTPMLLSQVPAETARAARSDPGSEPRYLAIGDGLSASVSDLDLTGLVGVSGGMGGMLLGLLTLLQFDSGLSDAQAVEAVRTRSDWKYALHLPIDHPALLPDELAEFRRRLQRSASGRRALGALQQRLAAYGVCEGVSSCMDLAAQVLEAVEALNELDVATRAMGLALEALAASNGDWLRTVSLPHWYERYGGSGSRGAASHTLAGTAGDIAHLLRAVEEQAPPELASLPEVAALRGWQRAWQARRAHQVLDDLSEGASA